EPTDSEHAFVTALRGPFDESASDVSEPGVPEQFSEDRSGGVVAGAGGKGAPGASECAASLAGLAAQKWPCVLIELDALGGGLDLRLGTDPREGSTLGLARAVRAEDGALGELLERWLTNRDGWPPALVGAP